MLSRAPNSGHSIVQRFDLGVDGSDLHLDSLNPLFEGLVGHHGRSTRLEDAQGFDVALPLRCSISVVPIQGGAHRGFEIFKAHGAFGGVDQLCVRTNQRSERR